MPRTYRTLGSELLSLGQEALCIGRCTAIVIE